MDSQYHIWETSDQATTPHPHWTLEDAALLPWRSDADPATGTTRMSSPLAPANLHYLFQFQSPNFALWLSEPRWGVHTTRQGGSESKNLDFAASAVGNEPCFPPIKSRMSKTKEAYQGDKDAE